MSSISKIMLKCRVLEAIIKTTNIFLKSEVAFESDHVRFLEKNHCALVSFNQAMRDKLKPQAGESLRHQRLQNRCPSEKVHSRGLSLSRDERRMSFLLVRDLTPPKNRKSSEHQLRRSAESRLSMRITEKELMRHAQKEAPRLREDIGAIPTKSAFIKHSRGKRSEDFSSLRAKMNATKDLSHKIDGGASVPDTNQCLFDSIKQKLIKRATHPTESYDIYSKISEKLSSPVKNFSMVSSKEHLSTTKDKRPSILDFAGTLETSPKQKGSTGERATNNIEQKGTSMKSAANYMTLDLETNRSDSLRFGLFTRRRLSTIKNLGTVRGTKELMAIEFHED